MFRRLVTAALAATCLVSAPAQAQAPGLTPDEVGAIFCLSRTGDDPGVLSGLLTPGLAAVIAEAEAQDAAWAAANPGEKPPLGDGIPWQSVPDHVDTCRADNVGWMMDEATLDITYGFAGAPEITVKDRLHLRLVRTRPVELPVWRIDNVRYDGGGDLRQVLTSAFLPN